MNSIDLDLSSAKFGDLYRDERKRFYMFIRYKEGRYPVEMLDITRGIVHNFSLEGEVVIKDGPTVNLLEKLPIAYRLINL